ncbi:MAG TPA: DUF4304 domain-containing protein [Archangium sp.]
MLVAALNEALVPAGFKKKTSSWFRRSDEVTEVVNLQRSRFGPQHYLNFGLWLCTLGAETFPRAERCHVYTRVESLVPSGKSLGGLLNLDLHELDAERLGRLVVILTNEFLPVTDRCRTVAGIRSNLDATGLRSAVTRAGMGVLL